MKLYVIAMDVEASEIVKDFELIQEHPYKLFIRENDLLAITKIGKVNAAFVLGSIISTYNIDLVINLGFVGANGDFNIGDILMVSAAKYHDFDLSVFGHDHGQVPGLPAIYKPAEKYTKLFDYTKAFLYTGDYFMTENKHGNYLVDMEGTAFFQVAYLSNIDIISIKIVSDVIGSKKHIEEYNDFSKNGSINMLKVFNDIKKRIGQ